MPNYLGRQVSRRHAHIDIDMSGESELLSVLFPTFRPNCLGKQQSGLAQRHQSLAAATNLVTELPWQSKSFNLHVYPIVCEEK
eukprot:766749-Hanusia_phi.AAC.2